MFGCSETYHRNREPEALVAGGVLYDDASKMRCTTRQEDVVVKEDAALQYRYMLSRHDMSEAGSCMWP